MTDKAPVRPVRTGPARVPFSANARSRPHNREKRLDAVDGEGWEQRGRCLHSPFMWELALLADLRVWRLWFGCFTWEHLWVFGLWLEGYKKSSEPLSHKFGRQGCKLR